MPLVSVEMAIYKDADDVESEPGERQPRGPNNVWFISRAREVYGANDH